MALPIHLVLSVQSLHAFVLLGFQTLSFVLNINIEIMSQEHYDRLLASYCLSVRLSVCPSLCDAVHCGSHGRCRGLKVVPSCSHRKARKALPIHFFRHCCTMYRSATKHSEGIKSRRASTANFRRSQNQTSVRNCK